MKGTVRFGIIGCGMIAQWHLDALRTIPEVEAVGAADADPARAAAFAGKNAMRPYADAAALLADGAIDAVCICTPSGLHAPLAIEAAEAGKHIVVEKPMAISLEQLRAVTEACEKSRVKLCAVSQLRFSPAFRSLKDAVDAGAFGRLICGDMYMKYHREERYFASSLWRGTYRMDGGGALMNQGIHGVDLLQALMGPVRSVFARSRTLAHHIETEDTLSAVLEYESGALGVIQAATAVSPGFERRLEINGTIGSASLAEDRILRWDLPGERPACGGSSDTSSDPGALSLAGHAAQLSDMVRAIRTDGKPAVDCAEGAKAVRIILAAYRSAESGRPVPLRELE